MTEVKTERGERERIISGDFVQYGNRNREKAFAKSADAFLSKQTKSGGGLAGQLTCLRIILI